MMSFFRAARSLAGRFMAEHGDATRLLENILVDAYGTDEQLWAFREAFHENIHFPVDAFVIGQPVSLFDIDYDGNERRGLFSRCRLDNSEYEAARAFERLLKLDPRDSLTVAALHRDVCAGKSWHPLMTGSEPCRASPSIVTSCEKKFAILCPGQPEPPPSGPCRQGRLGASCPCAQEPPMPSGAKPMMTEPQLYFHTLAAIRARSRRG